MIKKFIFFVLSISLVSQSVFAKPLGDMINDLFFDAEPSLEVPTDFISSGLTDGVWTKPKVGYSFQFTNYPGDPDQYLRREKLNLTLAIPVNLVENLPARLGPQLTAEFIRPFPKESIPKTAKTFVTKPPYLPHQVPHNHENADRVLKPGEYYAFTASMAFQITPSTASATGLNFLNAKMGVSAHIRYVVKGDFKVEVYRLADSKVKVIASSLRSRRVGAGIKARFVPDVEVFGFSLLDNLVNNKIEATLMDWNIFDNEKGNVFSVSYIYDLKTDEGKLAYDSLMDPRQWKQPTFKFQKFVKAQLEPTERTFWLADISTSRGYAEENVPGVEHVDHSELKFEKDTQGIRFDVKLADSDSRRHYAEIDYSFQPEAGGDVEHYRIANLEVDKDYQILFNLREAEVRREATAVFDLNDSQQIVGFRELHFFYRREDAKLKETKFQAEASAIIGQMRKMLPGGGEYTKDIRRLNDLIKPAYQNKEGSFVQMEMTLSPEAVLMAQSLTREDISAVVDGFIDFAAPKVASSQRELRYYYGDLELFRALDNMKDKGGHQVYFSNLKRRKIKENLMFAFQRVISPEQNEAQWEAFKSLQSQVVFRDFGAAILVRLLDRAARKQGKHLRDFIYFNVVVKVKDENEKQIHIGHYSRPAATKALITKKDRVMNRSYSPVHFKGHLN